MKKFIFFVVTCFLLLSCLQNDLELTYDEPSVDIFPVETFEIEGSWSGILNCPACCDDQYNFELEISNYNPSSGEITANLTISLAAQGWLAEAFAKYHCTGSFVDNILEINTTELYEEESSSCYFCEQNIYRFTVQENNDLLGIWTSSNNCDQSVISSASISITKQ